MAQVLANNGTGSYTFTNQQPKSSQQRKKYKDQFTNQ
jgi:hypothetical protein